MIDISLNKINKSVYLILLTEISMDHKTTIIIIYS